MLSEEIKDLDYGIQNDCSEGITILLQKLLVGDEVIVVTIVSVYDLKYAHQGLCNVYATFYNNCHKTFNLLLKG